MQTTGRAVMTAGLTAAMLTLAPLGWAQMDEDMGDDYSEMHGMGTMSPGQMGRMGQMEGMESMERGGRGGSMARMSAEDLKQRLGLSDEQTAKLKDIRRNYLKDTTMQGAKIRVAELELSDLLDDKKLDASKIEKKVKEIEALKSDLMMGRIRSLLKTADFLTPEQFDQLRAMTMRRMGAGMGGHMGEMKERRMGPPAGPGPHSGSGMPPGGMMGPHE
jgi:Spy/CpxP family protein refolding chaperone